MDSTKIFIDTDTEVTFILEKILESKNDRVCLVVPDRASIFNSISTLKLIKRVIDKSDKLLILVTLDDAGKGLASKVGIKCVSRVGELHEELWEEVQRNKFQLMKKSNSNFVQSNHDRKIVEEGNVEINLNSTRVVTGERLDTPKVFVDISFDDLNVKESGPSDAPSDFKGASGERGELMDMSLEDAGQDQKVLPKDFLLSDNSNNTVDSLEAGTSNSPGFGLTQPSLVNGKDVNKESDESVSFNLAGEDDMNGISLDDEMKGKSNILFYESIDVLSQ